MCEPLILLNQVSRKYKTGGTTVTALNNVTCKVKPGDRIAVLGASGSGKSTLLNIMGGLDEPTEGEILWPGLDLNKPLRPGQIGFVFQMASLIPTLSVIENVALPLLLSGWKKEAAYPLAMEILHKLNLEGLADKLPDELSGGQLQRSAAARVLTLKPKVILADEPTGQLDRAAASSLLDVLLSESQTHDMALVIATHDISAAERIDIRWVIGHGVMAVNAAC